MAAPKPNEWIAAYAKVQRATDAELLKILRDAFNDNNRMLQRMESQPEGIGRTIRREQLLTVKRQLLRQQAEVFRRTGDLIRARRLDAAARAIDLSKRVDEQLFAAVSQPGVAKELARSAMEGLQRTVESAISRIEHSARPLSERIYRVEAWMNNRVGNMINSALARGLSAREFAAEARDWFSPNTPGGIRYASMRLARTEINNAFHAISVTTNAEKPWVTGMQWHLSRSHRIPDRCNEYAGRDGFDMGTGVFPKNQVPSKPHPNCFCYVTPVVMDEDEFIDQLVSDPGFALA